MSIGTQQLLENYFAQQGLQKQAGALSTVLGTARNGLKRAVLDVHKATRTVPAFLGRQTIGRIPGATKVLDAIDKRPMLSKALHAAEHAVGYGALPVAGLYGMSLYNDAQAAAADAQMNSYLGAGGGAALGGGAAAALAYALAPEKSKRLAAAVAGLVGAGVGGAAGYYGGDAAIKGAKKLFE